MDFLHQLQTLVRGDIQQGKWMVGIALVVLLPMALFLFKNNLSLQKGMVIPVCLLIIITICYGGYILYSKPIHLEQTEQQFQSDPQQSLSAELEKAKTDDKSYSMLKYVWGICIIAFTVLYFVLSKDYYKGLSIGSVGLFFGFLMIDSFFHQRAKIYLDALQKLLD